MNKLFGLLMKHYKKNQLILHISFDEIPKKSYKREKMRQKGIDLNHGFYIVVGKQCRTENAYTGHQHNVFI